jgi:hypothetical protein
MSLAVIQPVVTPAGLSALLMACGDPYWEAAREVILCYAIYLGG